MLNDACLGLDVQPVRQPEHRHVLARVGGIEDVLVVDEDLADHRARALELGIGGNELARG